MAEYAAKSKRSILDNKYLTGPDPALYSRQKSSQPVAFATGDGKKQRINGGKKLKIKAKPKATPIAKPNTKPEPYPEPEP